MWMWVSSLNTLVWHRLRHWIGEKKHNNNTPVVPDQYGMHAKVLIYDDLLHFIIWNTTFQLVWLRPKATQYTDQHFYSWLIHTLVNLYKKCTKPYCRGIRVSGNGSNGGLFTSACFPRLFYYSKLFWAALITRWLCLLGTTVISVFLQQETQQPPIYSRHFLIRICKTQSLSNATSSSCSDLYVPWKHYFIAEVWQTGLELTWMYAFCMHYIIYAYIWRTCAVRSLTDRWAETAEEWRQEIERCGEAGSRRRSNKSWPCVQIFFSCMSPCEKAWASILQLSSPPLPLWAPRRERFITLTKDPFA